MIECPSCGRKADVKQQCALWVIECPKCHNVEIAETLEKAVRCFEHPTKEAR